jgi:hypothetical protein
MLTLTVIPLLLACTLAGGVGESTGTGSTTEASTVGSDETAESGAASSTCGQGGVEGGGTSSGGEYDDAGIFVLDTSGIGSICNGGVGTYTAVAWPACPASLQGECLPTEDDAWYVGESFDCEADSVPPSLSVAVFEPGWYVLGIVQDTTLYPPEGGAINYRAYECYGDQSAQYGPFELTVDDFNDVTFFMLTATGQLPWSCPQACLESFACS